MAKAGNRPAELLGKLLEDIDIAMLTTIGRDGLLVSRPLSTQRSSYDGRRVWLNAGVLEREKLGAIDSAGFESLRHQFEVNALGPLRVAQALLDNLADGSKIAIMTSRMGSMADNDSGGYYGYRASKAAVNAIGRSLAVDLKPRGVAVYLLHPGYVATDMVGRSGDITPEVAAQRLVELVDRLSLEQSGSFRHSNGSELPW